MHCEIYASTIVPLEVGKEARYSLLSEVMSNSYPLGYEIYGVKVDMGDETASRPRLTVSRNAVSKLLKQLVQGGVTPVGLDDVVDDWLSDSYDSYDTYDHNGLQN